MKVMAQHERRMTDLAESSLVLKSDDRNHCRF